MSRIPWLRLYTEARTDKKLAMLTLAERGVWVNLLCYASEREEAMGRGTFDASDRFVLALECADGDEALLSSTIEKLLRVKHLVDVGDGCLAFRTFMARQYDKPSATPARVADRVARHREIHRSQRQSNTDVTPCNTDVTRQNAGNALYEYGEGEGEGEKKDISSPPLVTKDDAGDIGGGGGENARTHTHMDTHTHTRSREEHPVASLPAAAAASASSASREIKLTQTERAEKLTALRDLTASVARAAKLTAYDATALETLVSRYEQHGRAWLLDEACAAADWIASERNKKLKEKQRRMNVAFLRNWFKKSEEGYGNGNASGQQATGQQSNSQSSAAIGSASVASVASAAVSGFAGVSSSVAGALSSPYSGGFPGNGRGRYSGPGSFGGRVEPGSREYWAIRKQIREERERQEAAAAAAAAASVASAASGG